MDAIERAIELAGSAAKLAEDIGVSPQYMSQLRSGTRPVPAERCPNIERATNGAVRCEDLRPDVDWAYLRATNCPAPESTQEAA
jgi:DNA-binding transcriptional regulator YdaS (Cro superfamily)